LLHALHKTGYVFHKLIIKRVQVKLERLGLDDAWAVPGNDKPRQSDDGLAFWVELGDFVTVPDIGTMPLFRNAKCLPVQGALNAKQDAGIVPCGINHIVSQRRVFKWGGVAHWRVLQK